MKVNTIRRQDIVDLLDKIGIEEEKPIAANKTRTVLSSIYAFGLPRNLVASNPCLGLPEKFPEPARERFLTDDEIVRFWHSTARENPVIRDLFRTLLLLGQRSGEVMAMKWSEIRDGVWYIPGARTKNGKEQVVPLPTYVRNILETHRATGHSAVFVARGSVAIQSLQKAKCRIETRMTSVPSWTAHDLRRTCASGMEQLGIPDSVIGSVLNHSKSSRQGVTSIYARHPYLKEKGLALEKWCHYIVQLTAKAEQSEKSETSETVESLEVTPQSEHHWADDFADMMS